MTIKLSILTLSLIASNILSGQDKIESEKEGPFLKGIFLENLNVTIPWGTTVEEISKYGSPQIKQSPTSDKWLTVSWDSVKILNNINATLIYSSKKVKRSYLKLTSIYIFIDTADVQKAYLYIEKKSGSPTKTMNKRKNPKYMWLFKKYYIQLTKGKHAGVFLVQSDTRGM